jgi:hypothetical protein
MRIRAHSNAQEKDGFGGRDNHVRAIAQKFADFGKFNARQRREASPSSAAIPPAESPTWCAVLR